MAQEAIENIYTHARDDLMMALTNNDSAVRRGAEITTAAWLRAALTVAGNDKSHYNALVGVIKGYNRRILPRLAVILRRVHDENADLRPAAGMLMKERFIRKHLA